jgi:hypothetical protein
VAAALAVLFALPRIALAQSITITGAPGTLGRLDANGQQVQLRGQNNYPYGISLSDCQANQSITFPIIMSGFTANMALEVWSGTTDCSDYTQRQGATQTCWKVAPNQALVTNETISVNVRNIIAQPATKTQDVVSPDSSICGMVDFTQFSVFFLLTQGSTTTLTSAKQDIQADTIGPDPVSGVGVTPGDTRLEVSWSSIGEAGVTTAANITIYYAASTGGGSTSDAGTTLVCNEAGVADGGLDEAGEAGTTVLVDAGCSLQPVESTGSTCSAPGFTSTGPDNTVSSISVGPTSSSATISGLTNGTSYAVAVAAQDAFLNNGALTDIVCETPIKLNDFFQTYRDDGGLAGGCAIDVLTGPAGAAATTVITLAGLLVVTRRRDRKEEEKKEQS